MSSSSSHPSSEIPSSTLFVAEIPTTIQESEFISLFAQQEGFITARIREDRLENAVGFVDFDNATNAYAAKERLQNFKFNPSLLNGLSIHFSHSSTGSGRSSSKKRETEDNPFAFPNLGLGIRGLSGLSGGLSYTPFGGVRSLSGLSGLSGLSALSGLNATSSNPFTPPTDSMGFPITGLGYNVTSPFSPQYPLSSLPIAASATSTLYIEGLPTDVTERELGHIFRPFQGYQSVRISTKESKSHPPRTFVLCFVEFNNKYQANCALHHIQGYRLDPNDLKGINVTFAKTERRTPLKTQAIPLTPP